MVRPRNAQGPGARPQFYRRSRWERGIVTMASILPVFDFTREWIAWIRSSPAVEVRPRSKNRYQPPYSPSVAIVPSSLSSPNREPASVSCAGLGAGDAAGGGGHLRQWTRPGTGILGCGSARLAGPDASGGTTAPAIGRVPPFRRGDFAVSAGCGVGSLSRQPMASTRRSRRTLIPGSGTPRMERAPSFRFGLKRSRNRMNC